jgi:CRISPR-associated protein (TIGR03986 family)
MNPKHIKDVSREDRKATAPYNFVELPEKIVDAESQPLPSGDRYHCDHHYTGRIKCTLTTETPLYTRCGWNPDDFAEYGKKSFSELSPEIQQERANFFINPATGQPMIPGSSLRGMLRTLVDIASFSKIDRVSDAQKLFFRAVAAEQDDPLREEYKKYINSKNVKAGYLIKNEKGWSVIPAQNIENQYPFIWVKEFQLFSIKQYIKMSDLNSYIPQDFTISFEDCQTKNTRRCFANKISIDPQKYKYRGVVVTSGNMLESSDNPKNLKRRNHCIIGERDRNAVPIPICNVAIEDYRSALTSFQQALPFSKNYGVLEDGRCIFYCNPESGKPITLFGQSPNFRIPYSPRSNGKASTARDFVPDSLKNHKNRSFIIDIAEAIFGFVESNAKIDDKSLSRAGRVFISDAKLAPNQDNRVRSSIDKDPKTILLSSPKPTSFQHYLVQRSDNKKELAHYACQPPNDTQNGETVIRGHKLYWHHKPQNNALEVANQNSDSQTSLVKPLESGIQFTFTIRFDNLRDFELGALLWVLKHAKGDYRLKLGMGKPLGMGTVKIDSHLYLSDRKKRYTELFSGNQWSTYETEILEIETYISCFETYIFDKISDDEHPVNRKATQLSELPRIKMLLAMLHWNDLPSSDSIKYMTLDDDDFKERKVLPTPLKVKGWEDERKSNNSSKTPNRPVPKPIIKPSNKSGNDSRSNHPQNQSRQQNNKKDNSGGSNSNATARPPKPPKS